jgi:hypothetical protein
MWAGFSARHHSTGSVDYALDLATKAAQWGADQELKACCEWLFKDPATHDLVGREARYLDFELRAARRPKPPSLKRRALIHFDSYAGAFNTAGGDSDLILEALESIPDPS